MRKFSFCGIFATLFVTTTIILLASCSQDDDYYESDMYTLAEMGTRGGGGDPGNGQPSPVITHVDSITEFHVMFFFTDDVFNSSDFQHSPFVAIDPSLYDKAPNIEADIWVTIQRYDNQPIVTLFESAPHIITDGPFIGHTFTVTDVSLQPDATPIPGRYILYATGTIDYVTSCTAFIPNRIYM